MGKILTFMLVALDVLIIAFIISSFVNYGNNGFPVGKVDFWVANAVEIGLAYLTYIFWKRSLRRKENNADRWKAIGLIAIGVLLPVITSYSGLSFLANTAYSETFYISATIALVLYANYKAAKLARDRE
jgi:uncharacterized membrane protein